MTRLMGATYSRSDLLTRVGDMAQIAGVRVSELCDGLERGVRIADVRTGTGFDYTVLIDRGLDIGTAGYRGASLAWRSPTTIIAPAFYEPEGKGWLRGFHGGLLTTCGLTTVGSPSTDGGEELGQHGRYSYLPASNVEHGAAWVGDEYEMWVAGQVRQATVFGENLVLRRRISSRLGTPRLVIDDQVTNEGFERTPLMLLYHINIGFPVVDAGAELLVRSTAVRPRDAIAAAGLAEHTRFEPPTAGYREQVFYHTLAPDADGDARVALVNRNYENGQGLGVYVRFPPAVLPHLVQWKMMGQGHYVCGLEPATNLVGGRAEERAAGRLQVIEPGESRAYRVEIGVLASQREIDSYVTV